MVLRRWGKGAHILKHARAATAINGRASAGWCYALPSRPTHSLHTRAHGSART